MPLTLSEILAIHEEVEKLPATAPEKGSKRKEVIAMLDQRIAEQELRAKIALEERKEEFDKEECLQEKRKKESQESQELFEAENVLFVQNQAKYISCWRIQLYNYKRQAHPLNRNRDFGILRGCRLIFLRDMNIL